MGSSQRDRSNSSSGEDISTHSEKETTNHPLSTLEILFIQEQRAGVALYFDWREGEGGSYSDRGDISDDGSDAMAASCGDLGGDLVGGTIDSMVNEETAKFILSLGARLKQIEDESASYKESIAEEDPFHDWGGRECNDFVPVLGEKGTKIAPTGAIFDQPLGQMQ